MIFTAVIRPGSTIDRMWTGHGRRAGAVNGVRFTKQGSTFISGELTPAEYAALEFHPCVRVEARGVAPQPQPLNITVEGDTAAPEFRPKPRAKPARK